MTQAKSTPVKGTKFYIEAGLPGAAEPITAVTATNPGTLTVEDTTASRGDVIVVSGLSDAYNGEFVVASVAADVITLAKADWSENTLPASYVGATSGALAFTQNFCDIKSFSRAGGTVDQNEITNICSDGKEFESGLYDGGTLALTFNYYPDAEVQEQLMAHEESGEKFWTKWVFPRNQGTLYHYGSIQTGANIDGAVGATYESGVSIKVSGRPIRVKAGA